MGLRFPPVVQFLERFRALLRRRRRFDFDQEAAELTRLEQAVAFLALLELRKAGEIRIEQAAPFAPIRVSAGAGLQAGSGSVSQAGTPSDAEEGDSSWNAPLRLISTNPVDELARTLEALLVVASQPLTVEDLAVAADDDLERVEEALELLGERFAEGRSGIVLEHVAGGYAFRASRGRGRGMRADVRASGRARSLAAALETLAVIAYLGPLLPARTSRASAASPPTRSSPVSSSADSISESGRDEGGAVRYRTTPLFERVFGLESLSALPRLDDLGGTHRRDPRPPRGDRRAPPGLAPGQVQQLVEVGRQPNE